MYGGVDWRVREALAHERECRSAVTAKEPYLGEISSLTQQWEKLAWQATAETGSKEITELILASRTVAAVFGEDSPSFIELTLLKSRMAFAKGDQHSALALALNAGSRVKSVYGKGTPRSVEPLRLEARVRLDAGDVTAAKDLLREAEKIGVAEISLPQFEYDQALVAVALGDFRTAAERANKVIELSRSYEDTTVKHGVEESFFQWSRIERPGLDLMLSLAAAGKVLPEAAYESHMRMKGGALVHEAISRAGRNTPEYVSLAKRRTEITRNLAHAALALRAGAVKDAAPSYSELFRLIKERGELAASMSIKSASLDSGRQRDVLKAADVARCIPNDSVLLDFVEFERTTLIGKSLRKEARLGVFVLRTNGIAAFLDLASASKVAELVAKWRQSAIANDAQSAVAAKESAKVLRRLIWEPVREPMGKSRSVMISPDGALCSLPFGVLPGENNQEYLLESFAFSIVTSPMMLSLRQEKLPQQPGVMMSLIGDVDYGPEISGTWGLKFARLPGTRREVESIQRLGETLAVGHCRISKGLVDPRLLDAGLHTHLHIASHGFFPERSEAQNLSPNVRGYEVQEVLNQTNRNQHLQSRGDRFISIPGLDCGLVFGAANLGPEGILTGLEVAEMNFATLDLAVLSACGTSVGRILPGQGMVGLQRAFEVAGARSTIASLWHVDDEATVDLMSEFYTNLWKKRMGKLEALRQAQLTMLRQKPGSGAIAARGAIERPLASGNSKERDYSRPFFWAGWVLSGDSGEMRK